MIYSPTYYCPQLPYSNLFDSPRISSAGAYRLFVANSISILYILFFDCGRSNNNFPYDKEISEGDDISASSAGRAAHTFLASQGSKL